MKRMPSPRQDPLAAYDACVAEIGDLGLRGLFQGSRTSIEHANDAFDAASEAAAWSGLPRVPRGKGETLVAGALSKAALMELYSTYMVKAKGSSRDIYDAILAAAGGICPFCGGLGQATTLDHFLPKANFPAYSVHPYNLVPCCRDCNTGKNASFGAQVQEQTLHPYLDLDHFFEERWVVASIHRIDPVLVRFECRPPVLWSAQDQDRVRHHFAGYGLAARFSLQACAETAKVVQLRKGSLGKLPPDSFRDYLLDSANCDGFVLNGWSRTTYAALAEADWFVEADFHDPGWHQ